MEGPITYYLGAGIRLMSAQSTVSFSLYVHPLSHTCDTGHINFSIQFIYYK